MRTAYRAIASLIALAVVLQIASIALAGFTIAKDADDGASIGADYSNFGQSYHSIAGTAIGAATGGLGATIKSYSSATRSMRESSGICSALSPAGEPDPSKFS